MLRGKPHLEQDKALNGPFAANGLRVCRIDKWLPPCSHGTESGLLVVLLVLLLKEKMKRFKNLLSSIIQKTFTRHAVQASSQSINQQNFFHRMWNQLAWILPFVAFIGGYFFLQFFIADTVVQVPALLGKNLLQATQICSEYKLNLRIIAEKEEIDVQPGTIVKQKPLPGKSIKPHQSIFIVITKLPAPVVAPDFIKKNKDQIEKLCQEKGIKNKVYSIETAYPQGECFGQIPLAGQALESKKMSSYISAGMTQHYLFPDFIHLPLSEVIDFLKKYNIVCDVYYKDQKITAPFKSNFIVMNQKPLSGTFVQLNNKLYVQIEVSV